MEGQKTVVKITRQDGIALMIPLGGQVLAWNEGSGDCGYLVEAHPAGAVVEVKGERKVAPWWSITPAQQDELVQVEIIAGEAGADVAAGAAGEAGAAAQAA